MFGILPLFHEGDYRETGGQTEWEPTHSPGDDQSQCLDHYHTGHHRPPQQGVQLAYGNECKIRTGGWDPIGPK